MISADFELFCWINGLAGRLELVDRLMAGLANDYFVPVFLSLSMIWLWFAAQTSSQREQNQKSVICAAISLGIANVVIQIFNKFYFRPRPFAEHTVSTVGQLFYGPTDSSFPSNPAAVGFAIALAVWFGNKKSGAIMLILAFLFSFARVYVGVCYPLDIAGGAIIGGTISYLLAVIMRHIEPLPTRFLDLMKRVYLA